LVDGEPRTLSLRRALHLYIDHRRNVIRRRSEYELERARARAHILEGLLKALDMLDQVIATIRKSRTVETARENLIKLLKCTEIQAQAILDMQLRRLAALEAKKIKDEYDEKVKLIKYLEGLLASPKKMRELIAEELISIKDAYNDPRRTVIADSTATRVTAADLLTPKEETWVTLTVNGKIGRSYDTAAPKVTVDTKEPPRFIANTDTNQIIYLFTTSGQCATIPVHQLTQINNPNEGVDFFSLCTLKSSDEIAAMLCLPSSLEQGFLIFGSEQGEVKRLRMEDLPGMRSDSFKVMDVEKGDRLIGVYMTTGEDEIVLATAEAQAIRFSEADVRPTGMGAGGMRGIKLAGQRDRVVGMGIAADKQHLFTITEDGIAKSTPLSEYPTQGRAGSGVITMTLAKGGTGLAAAAVGKPDEAIIVLTNKGKPKYMRLSLAPVGKRPLKGDYVISMGVKEQVASIAKYQSMVEAPENGGEE
ncbi:MAG: hypothetical protein KC519_02035, partial [Anaerolineae bacterium]|nr:hypothetical protein [Anaerolineae bacterium]